MLDIRIREYQQGRISITAGKKLLKVIRKWAMSYASEYQDKEAIELLTAMDKYLRNVREKEAHAVYKSIKSRKRSLQPLTKKEREIIVGSKYEGFLRRMGWLERPKRSEWSRRKTCD